MLYIYNLRILSYDLCGLIIYSRETLYPSEYFHALMLIYFFSLSYLQTCLSVISN